jgi:hypothetical protein
MALRQRKVWLSGQKKLGLLQLLGFQMSGCDPISCKVDLVDADYLFVRKASTISIIKAESHFKLEACGFMRY